MARRKQPIIPDQLLAGADAKTAFDKDGLLDELKKALAERALNGEIDHPLEAGEADGRANSRNGYGKKRVLTDAGKIDLEVPRDRLSTFDPQLIAKYQRCFPAPTRRSFRSASPPPRSLRCTRSKFAGSSHSFSGAPFLSAPGLRASTGT